MRETSFLKMSKIFSTLSALYKFLGASFENVDNMIDNIFLLHHCVLITLCSFACFEHAVDRRSINRQCCLSKNSDVSILLLRTMKHAAMRAHLRARLKKSYAKKRGVLP